MLQCPCAESFPARRTLAPIDLQVRLRTILRWNTTLRCLLHTDTLSHESLLHRLGEFARLNQSGWDRRILNVRSNSGSHLKGRGSHISTGNIRKNPAPSIHSVREGVYEISHFRPMLNATRALIYERERAACTQISHEFGVGCHYDADDRV